MNNVTYFEIQVDNIERAKQFYQAVFNWQYEINQGVSIEYWRIITDGIHGGLMARPTPAPHPGSGTNAFVCSMQAENYDETEAKILAAGGQIALPKFAIPGVCWQGYYLDTEGNTFGIFQADEKAA